jgi:hypothetical protein
LPYLQGYERAPAASSVTIYDERNAYDGLNFIVSADAPNASLTDMKGRVVHQWRKAFDEGWSENRVGLPGTEEVSKACWRRAQLLDNGDVLAIFTDFALIRVDKNSRLLWAYEGGVHHDMFTHADGTIYVLTRDWRARFNGCRPGTRSARRDARCAGESRLAVSGAGHELEGDNDRALSGRVEVHSPACVHTIATHPLVIAESPKRSIRRT